MSAPSDTTVLVIDDDGGWRCTLARWLELDGFHVAGVSRAKWAAGDADAEHADLVILDVPLTGLDDLALLGAVRRRWPRLPVIVTTAFGGPETAGAARRCGAACYMEKPFRMADLTTEMRRLVSAKDRSARSRA